MNTDSTLPDRLNNWMKHSVTLKLISIAVLILILLIPTSMVKEIIYERETLSQDAIQEVSSKWANNQTIKGPILTIPITYYSTIKNEDGSFTEISRNLNILPDDLQVNGQMDPESLKRGIYEIVVYKSKMNVNGSFSFNPKFDKTNLKQVHWDQAFLTLGITDLRGIKDNINLTWGDKKLRAEPGSKIMDLISSGVTIDLPEIDQDKQQNINFNFGLNLQGSENLSFIPIENTTEIKLTSSWTDPSFNGNFLPNDRLIDKNGFSADWKILQLNRNFPQSWINDKYSNSLDQSAFGVDLMLPLDDYQKSMRSAKYAIMTIALTFLIFFLVEVLNGEKIHALQYTLVGLSLCLFYVLLISISEHSNFNLAYIISAIAVIGMISLYSISVFKTKKITLLLSAVLCGVYGFLFVTLQLADFALLLGSVGLALILGATMYFTRNINWYAIGKTRLSS